jgi:type II secretory pathway component GspD/PulD (secretin)
MVGMIKGWSRLGNNTTKISPLAGNQAPTTRRPVPLFNSRQVAATLLACLLVAGPVALPAQGAADPKLEIALADGRMETFIMQFNSQSPRKLSVYGKVAEQRVTIFADGESAESILNQVANKSGWVWWREDDGSFGLSDKEFYERNILPKRVIQKVFRPNNIKASELDRAIKGLLTPNVGSSVADDRTNKLIINDLPPQLERIERFIREIDVQLIVRVFYIRRAKVEDIAKKLEQYKSGPGSIEVDVNTRQIIVTDLLSNIKKMELLVDILDVGPEIVQYDINNIGIDGKELEGLQKIIDSLRTSKDLLFEVNTNQGVMILEDVPEVHERVEQILAEFDKPIRQVLLQGEILSTSFSREFSFGLTNFAWSDDILAASRLGAVGTPGFVNNDVRAFEPLSRIFPTIGLSGKTVTGNYLSQTVALQYQAVYEDTSTKVLLQPSILVKNQSKSTIFVGQELPILTTFFNDNNNNSGVGRTTSQTSIPSGLKFEVTPSISNSFLVELDLRIDNDTAKRVPLNDGDRTVDGVERDRQNVQTILQIPSGQTRMIGGLIRDSSSDTSSGLPFLSSLPIIGALFGVKGNNKQVSNLILFITPTIVEDEMPRNLNNDGRRGRSLTQYERIPGAYTLDQEGDAPDALRQTGGNPPPAELELGTSEEEAEVLEEARRRQAERNRALSDENTGNYTPSAGFGSATLNTGGGTSPATGSTRPAATPPRDSGRTPPAPTGGASNNRAPGGNVAPGGAVGTQRSETIYR